MVNFFDVATPEEIEVLFGEKPTQTEIDETREEYEKSPNSNNAHLYYLYLDRGESEEAEKYLNLIDDEVYKQNLIDAAFDIDI